MVRAAYVPDKRLPLFAEDRLPRKPWCSDDLAFGAKVRPLPLAARAKYIQLNRPGMQHWLVFDVDREQASIAWEQAGLPPPAWAAINHTNAHAHLVWSLASPVCTSRRAAAAPMLYLDAIEEAFRARLDADGNYRGPLTKNPLHPAWLLWQGPQRSYELSELAEYVELRRPRGNMREEESESHWVGRNCALFDQLRCWAYRRCPEYRGGGVERWRTACEDAAAGMNAEFAIPLGWREVAGVARSVAKWTWVWVGTHGGGISDSFSATQARRARQRGMLVRSQIDWQLEKLEDACLLAGAFKSRETLVARVRELRVNERYSVSALASAAGVSERTMKRWLS